VGSEFFQQSFALIEMSLLSCISGSVRFVAYSETIRVNSGLPVTRNPLQAPNAAFNSSRGALPEIPAQLFWQSYFF
jgi:hypothetical protein